MLFYFGKDIRSMLKFEIPLFYFIYSISLQELVETYIQV